MQNVFCGRGQKVHN